MNQVLAQLIREYALKIAPEGEMFTLKSGAKSKYYFDLRKLHLVPKGLHEVVHSIWSKLSCDIFGGPSIGADPIIGGLVLLAYKCEHFDARGFLIRPAGKEHGLSGRIVGPLKPGDRCTIIEDVATTGQSIIDSIDVVESIGAKVIQVITVLDREQGAAKLIADRGINFTSLIRWGDIQWVNL